MNPDSENFDSLRRLLALKRHEQPPPGYFNRFSRDVMARIKAGETGGEMAMELPWIQRVLAMFDVKPIYAGAFGTAVCALLISGVVSSESAGHAVATNPSFTGGKNFADVGPSTPAAMPVETAFTQANTNPVVSQSLFEQFQPQIDAQPASERVWVPNGN
jgi:hypothetical protein